MSSSYVIDMIYKNPSITGVVAQSLVDEWTDEWEDWFLSQSHTDGFTAVTKLKEWLDNMCATMEIPLCLVISNNVDFIGCCCICKSQLDHQSGISFLITNMMIVPTYRNNGYGTILFQRILDYWDDCHLCESLFLEVYTDELERFYNKFGFYTIEKCLMNGKHDNVKIMKRVRLGPTQNKHATEYANDNITNRLEL